MVTPKRCPPVQLAAFSNVSLLSARRSSKVTVLARNRCQNEAAALVSVRYDDVAPQLTVSVVKN